MANKVEQVRKEAEEKLSEFFNIVSDKVDEKKSKMNTQKEETSSVKCQTEKCLDLANNEQKIKYSRYYYESIAKYYRNETSDYEKAVENYKKAVKASEETGKIDCYLYRNMGYAYEANGDYKNAYDTYRFVESRNPETVNIIESIMRVEKYLSSEKTKEQIDEDNYISDAYYTFQSSSKRINLMKFWKLINITGMLKN